MFYLKYRPKTLEEIDNSKARETLTNILTTGRLPHAFLFVGQKGTGKTSSARILAKAINCLNNKFGDKSALIDPCNRCHNCLSIDSGTSPDVVEMDAASNRGINEVKELIKGSAFSPMAGRYRVFIIDEAHMITADGFNALLKTLEEPPETVIFILATTNPEKVPKTIGSRCLIVNFGKAKQTEIKRMLGRIAGQEKLKVEEDIIDLIASHSERSFRDAAKLFEELVIQDKLILAKAREYLGIRSKQSLLDILQNETLAEALGWIEEFTSGNGNYKNLIEEMLEELHVLLLKKSGINITDEIEDNLSLSEITKLMKLLNESYSLMKTSPIESLPLEIAIVEFYNIKSEK